MLNVFNRQCFFSTAGAPKHRPSWFDRKENFKNLDSTPHINLQVVFDEAKGTLESSPMAQVLLESGREIIKIKSDGTEASAFRLLLAHIAYLPIARDELVYIVEDDYIHKKDWKRAIYDGFNSTPCDYLTLYDHPDKYKDYPDLKSRIYVGKVCHWRTTPSTTNTFAVRMGTLMDDLKVSNDYSTGVSISRDHDRFVELGKRGRILVSSIPGFSTHIETDNLTPFWK